MFMKQPQIRQFKYTPRFYKPESEEEEDQPRIKFRRLITRRPVPRRSFWGMLIVIILLILLFHYLKAYIKPDKQEFQFEDLKIETIE